MKQILEIIETTTWAEWLGDLVGVLCLFVILFGGLWIGAMLAPECAL